MERAAYIENFDLLAVVFARKTTDFEFSVTNEIIAKERFRHHFIKVPELLVHNEIKWIIRQSSGWTKPNFNENINIGSTS